MGILSWIILGLIAGFLAKLFMPGKDKSGIIITILLGVAGAFFGGWVGSFLGLGTTGGLNFSSIATATVGAALLLFIYRRFKR